MPFEPALPSDYQYLFHGHCDTQVTDPHGIPSNRIISRTDDWHLQVNWQVHGLAVPSIGGTWHVKAYLESIGPGPELEIASRDVPMTGLENYSELFFIGPNVPNQDGAYKLVTCLTSSNLLGGPAPFAAVMEGDILQFFSGPSLPPTVPTP